MIDLFNLFSVDISRFITHRERGTLPPVENIEVLEGVAAQFRVRRGRFRRRPPLADDQFAVPDVHRLLLHEVFNRKLEQIRQKYLISSIPRDLVQAGNAAQDKDVFSRTSERIDDLFVQAGRNLKPDTDTVHQAGNKRELEERLFSLELEARQQINSLFHSYMEKAQAIDEYILHPNLKDIHFVRSCILWMPVKAD